VMLGCRRRVVDYARAVRAGLLGDPRIGIAWSKDNDAGWLWRMLAACGLLGDSCTVLKARLRAAGVACASDIFESGAQEKVHAQLGRRRKGRGGGI